jgi:integrase
MAVTLPWGKPDGDPVTARLLFTRPDGRAIHRQSFGYDWQAARDAAGAPPTRENGMHVLRATFASACLSEGVDIRTLSEWLGHTDASITLKYYAHLMPSAAGRGRKAIDKFLRGCAPDVPSGS